LPHYLTNHLINTDEYAQFLGYPTPTDPDKLADLEWAMEAASEAIQSYCGRAFLSETPASARYFDSEDSRRLDIDDCTAVTEIAVDTGGTGTFTALAATEYQLLPPGGRSRTLGVVPYQAVMRIGGLWPHRNRYPLTFTASHRVGLVRVTALWGWTAVPHPVKRATAIFTQDLLRDKEATFGGVATTTEGVTIMSRMPRRVADLCGPFRRMDVVLGLA
jgi:hypothetical protein